METPIHFTQPQGGADLGTHCSCIPLRRPVPGRVRTGPGAAASIGIAIHLETSH